MRLDNVPLAPSRRRLGRFLTAFIAVAGVAACGAGSAHAFGTVNGILGQHSEHERITRLGLQCSNGAQPPACFQSLSLDNLAGRTWTIFPPSNGTFGAVGSPDDLILHVATDRDYWHCDNADWVDARTHGISAYPRSRTEAMDAIRECVKWGRDKLYDGNGTWDFPTATPRSGAVATAAQLLTKSGQVNNDWTLLGSTCTFNGSQSNRVKCNVLEPFGYVLHMAEDFYSHTNWPDLADPAKPLSLANPIGLGNSQIAAFLDLRRESLPTDAEIPANLTGACYPTKSCAGRVIHGDGEEGINKDREIIDTKTGKVTDPGTPRGKIVVDGKSNAQRAVEVAVPEVRRQWEVFRAGLAQRYGNDKAAKMICALVLDVTKVCDTRNVVVAIDTSPPVRGVKAATAPTAGPTARAAAAGDDDTPAMETGQALIDRLSSTDRVSVVTFDSSNGDQDVDPFLAPSRARIDDAGDGDRAADPSTAPKDDDAPHADDPTLQAAPDPAGDDPTPEDEVDPSHVHLRTAKAAPTPTATAAAAAPAVARAATPAPATSAPAVARAAADGDPVADALGSADALLTNDDTPRGQRGVVLVTNRIGDAAALARRIRDLGEGGAVVSVALNAAAEVPESVVVAVESTGGVVLSAADATQLRRFANVADRNGLTSLDTTGVGDASILDFTQPRVQGATDAGDDVHDVAALDQDGTVRVRALEQRVTMVVTDHRTGRSKSVAATGDRDATMKLEKGGDYEVAIEGGAGRRYVIGLTPAG